MTDTARLTALAQRVITEVAAHFRPKTDRAELDVPLRNILFIVEQVCRDMREILDGWVPFSHLITVRDGLQLLKWRERFWQANYLRRTLSMAAAIARKLPESLRAHYLRTLAEGQQKDKLQLLFGQLKIHGTSWAMPCRRSRSAVYRIRTKTSLTALLSPGTRL